MKVTMEHLGICFPYAAKGEKPVEGLSLKRSRRFVAKYRGLDLDFSAF